MGFKIANTEVINDSGDFVGDFGGLVVNCQLVFQDLRCFQGTTSGYNSGGFVPAQSDIIDKFPFSSDTPATDVGELTQSRYSLSGQSSAVSGYTSGGDAPPKVDTIDKFPFASDTSATDVGEITAARWKTAGQSAIQYDNGYVSGGEEGPPTTVVASIDKFPFAADASATNIGSLSQARECGSGQSSLTNGYTAGGSGPTALTIDKFPFATDASATDVGDLTLSRSGVSGQSSSTHGYAAGGISGAPTFARQTTIEKFTFSSDANATDVGELLTAIYRTTGQSSTVSGYVSGGDAPPSSDTIQKYPFASDTSSTDVGEMTQSRQESAGQQV